MLNVIEYEHNTNIPTKKEQLALIIDFSIVGNIQQFPKES